MAFTEEFIEQNGLQPEQVSAITGYYDSNVIPTLKKEWDGKANGEYLKLDTYVYKVVVKSKNNETREYIGHVNLIR